MAVKCETGKLIGHLFVTAASSDGTRPVCTLGIRTNVHHRVEVENLYGYDAYVSCEGTIQNHASRVIKFQSRQPGDSTTQWVEKKFRVPVWLSHVFGLHVALLPDTPGAAGTEIVSATLEVTWPEPEVKDKDTVDIEVDA
jgi:hypothetical protein